MMLDHAKQSYFNCVKIRMYIDGKCLPMVGQVNLLKREESKFSRLVGLVKGEDSLITSHCLTPISLKLGP